MKEILKHDRLGEITVSRTRRSNRISISVRPPAVVRLNIPMGVSMGKALAFLEEKADWVEQAVDKAAARSKSNVIDMLYTTHLHILRFDPKDVREIKVNVNSPRMMFFGFSNHIAGEIIIEYPFSMNFRCEEVQQAARDGILEAMRREAKVLLPLRVKELADKHGLSYGKVRLSNATTRWGSCSVKDDISLNIRIMKLPWHLIDYIILHELCHTVHRNHGKGYQALLDKVCDGKNAALRCKMRTHNIEI